MAAFAQPQNSTNVRSGSGSTVGFFSEAALALFKTPRRTEPERSLRSDGFELEATRVEVHGERLATWSFGSGPTILLVHGWNGHAAQLRAFVQPLVDAGYRVVAFDQPAHGRSTGTRAHVLDFARAVEAIAAREKPVAIVAHSLGATGAALAVARGTRVRRLALLAPPAEVPFFVRAAAQRMGVSREVAAEMLELVAQELGDLDALDLRRVSLRADDVLVMHDPEDREVPFEHGRAIAERHGRLEAPFGAGHRGMLRDPQLVARIVAFATGEG